MTDGFTKGAISKLPEGIVRWEVVYRVMGDDEEWNVRRMWRTAKEDAEPEIAKELQARLSTKIRRFEIVSIRSIGNEIPIRTGSPTAVVTPAEYENMKNADRAKFGKSDVRERAKALGLYFPGMEDKYDA